MTNLTATVYRSTVGLTRLRAVSATGYSFAVESSSQSHFRCTWPASLAFVRLSVLIHTQFQAQAQPLSLSCLLKKCTRPILFAKRGRTKLHCSLSGTKRLAQLSRLGFIHGIMPATPYANSREQILVARRTLSGVLFGLLQYLSGGDMFAMWQQIWNRPLGFYFLTLVVCLYAGQSSWDSLST